MVIMCVIQCRMVFSYQEKGPFWWPTPSCEVLTWHLCLSRRFSDVFRCLAGVGLLCVFSFKLFATSCVQNCFSVLYLSILVCKLIKIQGTGNFQGKNYFNRNEMLPTKTTLKSSMLKGTAPARNAASLPRKCPERLVAFYGYQKGTARQELKPATFRLPSLRSNRT